MTIQIQDTIALVTGANRGIGRALVEALLERGAKKVYATARRPDALDDLVVRVIETVLLERALAETAGELIAVGTAQVENLLHIDVRLHESGLLHVAGNAIEHKRIRLGMKPARARTVMDEVAPKLDCRLIGNQLPLAGIFQKCLADRAIRF